MEQKTKFDNGTAQREPNFATLNKEGLFTIVDKMAIEDWKNSKPAGC